MWIHYFLIFSCFHKSSIWHTSLGCVPSLHGCRWFLCLGLCFLNLLNCLHHWFLQPFLFLLINNTFYFSWLFILEHMFFSYFTSCGKINIHHCRNPTLAKCGSEAQHLEKVRIWSPPGLPNVHSSTARPKTPLIGVFLVSLKRSWNVNIENGLALTIRTSTAQVMGKRRAGSQIDSLTPDH